MLLLYTLPKTNLAPENETSQKERIVFQPSLFRCELLVSVMENDVHFTPPWLRSVGGEILSSILCLCSGEIAPWNRNPCLSQPGFHKEKPWGDKAREIFWRKIVIFQNMFLSCFARKSFRKMWLFLGLAPAYLALVSFTRTLVFLDTLKR